MIDAADRSIDPRPDQTSLIRSSPFSSLTPPHPTDRPTTNETGLAGALGLVAGASTASAGFLNSDSLPEVIKPKDAEIDQDLVKSSDVRGTGLDWVETGG